MKKYYVQYGDFGNTYSLRWSDGPAPAGYERITRKRAEDLCRDENYRREHDPNFSGYADNLIYPASWRDADFEDYSMYPQRHTVKGYIVED